MHIVKVYIPVQWDWDLSLGTVQHNMPAVDGRHWEISPCAEAVTPSTKTPCAPLLMVAQNRW